MIALVAVALLAAPPCGVQDVCAYRASLCQSMRYYRADQIDRARVDEKLSACRADLDYCRAAADSTATMLRRQLETSEAALAGTQTAALRAARTWSQRERELRDERDSKWSAWEVVGLSVGVALGAGLAGGLIAWGAN